MGAPSELEQDVTARRLGPPRGIDRLKQGGIDCLHPRQQPDHTGVAGTRPHDRQVEAREIERQLPPVRIDRCERTALTHHQCDGLDLAHNHLQRTGRTPYDRSIGYTVQSAQALGEWLGFVEHARSRRQPQRRQDLIGIEIPDADDFDLAHTEKPQPAQPERRRHPEYHDDHRRARPRQHTPRHARQPRDSTLPFHATAPCSLLPAPRIPSSSGPTLVMSPAPSVNTTSPPRTARATWVVSPARSRTATVAAPARVAPRTTR